MRFPDFDQTRGQQPLRRGLAFGEPTKDPIVEHPLVGHVLIDDHQTVVVLEQEEGIPILADEAAERSVGGPRFGSRPLRRVVAGDRRVETSAVRRPGLGVSVIGRVGKERRAARQPAAARARRTPAARLGHARACGSPSSSRLTATRPWEAATPCAHGPFDQREDRARIARTEPRSWPGGR